MTENVNKAEEIFEAIPGMKVYYLRLLKRGPIWTPEESPELERVQAAHLAHGRRLVETGKLLLNGPLLDNGDLRGVGIFLVDSLEEAQALSDADPAVLAGRLVSEIHPWMVHRGVLPE